jgi:hypothetical protein
MGTEPSLPGIGECNHVVCARHRAQYRSKGCRFEEAVKRAEARLEAARRDLAHAIAFAHVPEERP